MERRKYSKTIKRYNEVELNKKQNKWKEKAY